MNTESLESTDIQGHEAYDMVIEGCELKEYGHEYIWGPLFALAAGIGFMSGKTWAVYLVSCFKNKSTF